MREKLIILLVTVMVAAFAGRADSTRTVRYGPADGLSSRLVGGAVQDSRGLLWFATWNGLNCYDGYEFHHVRIRPGDRASIGTNQIRDILLSDDGDAIICHTDNGVYEFSLTDFSFIDIAPERREAYQQRVGRRWHGLTDSQGNLWTADREGLYKTVSSHHPASVVEGTAETAPRAFMRAADGRLWVSTRYPAGITVFNRDSTVAERMDLPFVPYSIFEDSRGRVWLGGKPGGFMQAGGKMISDDAVYDIAEDSRGRLWIATFGNGIKCLDAPATEKQQLSVPLGGRKVRKLLITPDGMIVAATTEGLLVSRIPDGDPAAIEFRAVRRNGARPESLASDATMSLARDSEGNIYVATQSSGVDMVAESALMTDSAAFTHFSQQTGALSHDFCTSLALAADTLLIVTGTDGVMMLDPRSGRSVNLSRCFWGDSCAFTEATPIVLPDGSWLLGGEKGVYRATAHNIFSRGFVPSIVFTTLAVNGGAPDFSLPSRSGISLRADERNVTIGFAALDFTNNSDILYRTSLDGSPATGGDRVRSVTLFNLTPGHHELQVQSTDRYGRWVDNVATLMIDVEPYWHETWWARLLFAILATAALAVATYTVVYVRRVNRHRRELLEKYLSLIAERSAAVSPEIPVEPAEDPAPPEVAAQKPEDLLFLQRVRHYIETHISDPEANIDDMAAAAAASRSTLNRRLRSLLGISAAQLLIDARMKRAATLLADPANSEVPVKEIASLCGYADHHYFQRVFKIKFNVSPSEFRKS